MGARELAMGEEAGCHSRTEGEGPILQLWDSAPLSADRNLGVRLQNDLRQGGQILEDLHLQQLVEPNADRLSDPL